MLLMTDDSANITNKSTNSHRSKEKTAPKITADLKKHFNNNFLEVDNNIYLYTIVI